jgi:uncharacterized membrane protein YdjX (TVP38/TMEM64 family)
LLKTSLEHNPDQTRQLLRSLSGLFLINGSFWQYFLWYWQSENAKVGTPKEIAMSTRKILSISLAVITLPILWRLHAPLASMLEWFSDWEAVSRAIHNSGFWGPAILFVLFVLQTFIAFIPGQALMIASGYIYGFTGGFLITWISLVAGGQMAFWLARRYGRDFAEKWISPAVLDRWDKSAAGSGIGFFAITLVLPFFPNDAMCYVAGLGRISAQRFLIANMLGRGMASFITVLVGAYGSKIPMQVWVGAGLLIVLGILGWQIAKRVPNPFVKGGSHINA